MGGRWWSSSQTLCHWRRVGCSFPDTNQVSTVDTYLLTFVCFLLYPALQHIMKPPPAHSNPFLSWRSSLFGRRVWRTLLGPTFLGRLFWITSLSVAMFIAKRGHQAGSGLRTCSFWTSNLPVCIYMFVPPSPGSKLWPSNWQGDFLTSLKLYFYSKLTTEKEKRKRKVKPLSHVPLFATPWTVACQAPLSMGFFRQEYWNGLPFPSPGDLPDPRDWTRVSHSVNRCFTV